MRLAPLDLLEGVSHYKLHFLFRSFRPRFSVLQLRVEWSSRT